LEHPVSFLYHPVNKLLVALFGESSHRFQELMGLHEAGYWLPDHVVMAMLVVVLVAAVLMLVLGGDDTHAAFRGMVTALIVLGIFGYQMATRATRSLTETVVALTGGARSEG